MSKTSHKVWEIGIDQIALLPNVNQSQNLWNILTHDFGSGQFCVSTIDESINIQTISKWNMQPKECKAIYVQQTTSEILLHLLIGGGTKYEIQKFNEPYYSSGTTVIRQVDLPGGAYSAISPFPTTNPTHLLFYSEFTGQVLDAPFDDLKNPNWTPKLDSVKWTPGWTHISCTGVSNSHEGGQSFTCYNTLTGLAGLEEYYHSNDKGPTYPTAPKSKQKQPNSLYGSLQVAGKTSTIIVEFNDEANSQNSPIPDNPLAKLVNQIKASKQHWNIFVSLNQANGPDEHLKWICYQTSSGLLWMASLGDGSENSVSSTAVPRQDNQNEQSPRAPAKNSSQSTPKQPHPPKSPQKSEMSPSIAPYMKPVPPSESSKNGKSRPTNNAANSSKESADQSSQPLGPPPKNLSNHDKEVFNILSQMNQLQPNHSHIIKRAAKDVADGKAVPEVEKKDSPPEPPPRIWKPFGVVSPRYTSNEDKVEWSPRKMDEAKIKEMVNRFSEYSKRHEAARQDLVMKTIKQDDQHRQFKQIQKPQLQECIKRLYTDSIQLQKDTNEKLNRQYHKDIHKSPPKLNPQQQAQLTQRIHKDELERRQANKKQMETKYLQPLLHTRHSTPKTREIFQSRQKEFDIKAQEKLEKIQMSMSSPSKYPVLSEEEWGEVAQRLNNKPYHRYPNIGPSYLHTEHPPAATN